MSIIDRPQKVSQRSENTNKKYETVSKNLEFIKILTASVLIAEIIAGNLEIFLPSMNTGWPLRNLKKFNYVKR